MKSSSISNQTCQVNGINIFYREAGTPENPTLLLLHGFPTSSHMFRNLIPKLADKFHLVAPDLPGFGFSDAPDHKSFRYTFENLAEVIWKFTEQLWLEKFAIYVFDYGAPVGFRLALNHPDRITGIISQNGNPYLEGLSDAWNLPARHAELVHQFQLAPQFQPVDHAELAYSKFCRIIKP